VSRLMHHPFHQMRHTPTQTWKMPSAERVRLGHLADVPRQ
jgi:hypothetical protein